jgi:hypothetical protein
LSPEVSRSAERLTILFSGMIAGVPYQGGATWAVLQYLLGLRDLGHDVYFVEPVPGSALRPAGAPLRCTTNAAYFASVCADFALRDSAALLVEGTREAVGMSYDRVAEVARRADVLINIAGMLTDADLTGRIPVRIYLDLDPAFTQLWHAVQGIDMRFDGHTHFATVGLAIGQPSCLVPACGREWITTPPPVVLRYWPVANGIVCDALTTLANWRSYGSIAHDGVFYGQKAHSLRPLIDLPTRTNERIALALSIDPDERTDRSALAANGWQLQDPIDAAATPNRYRRFVRGSKAEFGIAKSGYVASRCGWFSDRSVWYLASGRPVIAQETGFSSFLPTGAGLFAFVTGDDVLAAIAALRADYAWHARSARAITEEVFDARLVLPNLLRRVGVAG